MEKKFKILLALIIGFILTPSVVFADELDDEFNRIAPNGVIEVNSVMPKSAEDIDAMVYASISTLASGGYWISPVFTAEATDFTNIKVQICKVVQETTYETCGESREFDVKLKYSEANSKVSNYVNVMLDKFKKMNFSDDNWLTTAYRIEDLGLVNYYYNMSATTIDEGLYGNLIKYSNDFIRDSEGSNLVYKMDMRAGVSGDDYLYGGCFGNMIAYYNGVAYNYADMAMVENKVLYIPLDTSDNPESYIAAAKKRIKDVLNIDVEITLGGTIDSLKNTIYNNSLNSNCDESCALSNSEDIVNSQVFDYTTTDGNYYIFTINGIKVKFFIQKKDLSTVEKPIYNGKDILTDISISSNNSIIPLDTALNVQEITSGQYYDKILKLLSTSNFKTFDIKLFSNNKNSYISKLDNGEFIVKIPVPETLKDKQLVVYYIDESGNKETYSVTVENDYLVFKTKHFSEYTVAELADTSKETIHNPNTYDNVGVWTIVLLVSVLGTCTTTIYLNKNNM